MTKVQVRLAVGILAVVVCGGAFALFVKQSHGRGERDDHRSDENQAVAPQKSAAEPPIKLGLVDVRVVREYFSATGYTFEDESLPGNVARVIGTSQDGQTVLEFVGLAPLKQATLRYTLRDNALNGRDMAAIMYLLQHVKADEADVRWAIDAARKGEPSTRTIGAVVYAIQRGPSGTSEFMMRPAPGFE